MEITPLETKKLAAPRTRRGIEFQKISGTAQESERLPERLVFSEKGFWLA